MQHTFKYYWPAILWALFIFIMCTINLGEVSNSPSFFPGFDKLVHCGFFFVLVVMYCYGSVRQQLPASLSYKTIIIFTLVAILYGGIIELLQNYVFTWRTGDWADLFADSVGALMGAFSVSVVIYAINYDKK
ncbi:MAG TPA: VanZ family protein [Mucilaginibacter sp.]|jgi:VanZ family protein|nr:VanZ family protein [Mucilaginibacter sp.]